MTNTNSVMPVRELKAVMTLKEFQSFCRPNHPGRYPVFAVRASATSQKWTVYVFQYAGSTPKAREVWTGLATIPDVKETVRRTLLEMGFSAISGLIQGKNEISCFAVPAGESRRAMEKARLDSPQRRSGVIISGIRHLTEYGFQTNSPGPEMVEMLVGQYDWTPRERLSAVQHACKLTGPESMAFIGGLLTRYGTPEMKNE
ncbi:hypothetical protein [Arthrobacter sp. HLT1-20]